MTIYTGDDNNNTLVGLDTDDVLYGFGGDDILIGGGGNDVLLPGLGTDTMTGGTGVDTFSGTAADLNGDTITDLLIGDRIQITDTSLNHTNSNVHVVGSDLVFNGGLIHIGNFGPGRLVQRDISGGGIEVRLQAAAHNDFNGDARSDLLWRHDSGWVTDWLSTGTSFDSNWSTFNTNPGSNWHVAGTGDFNGDGYVDILWKDDIYGTVTDWLGSANGGFVGNWSNLQSTPAAGLSIVGVGDFNGDTFDDVLLRNNTSGGMVEWLGQANGGFAVNTSANNAEPGISWKVAGTGDFNGDGIQDILWRNQSGTVTNWLGTTSGTFSGNWDAFHTNPGTSWEVVGTGDFNGDGLTDILWRDTVYGTITDWFGSANGNMIGNWDNLHAVLPANSSITSIGDFNGDAIDDLLLTNKDTGTLTQWLGRTDGSFAINSQFANPSPGAGWHVQDPFVHDPFA